MARIFDCFIFSREFDLLEIRLHELANVVDFFVIAESATTHQGKPKPLFFQENQERFAAFADRIRHIVVGQMPKGGGQADHYRREYHQRNALLAGLDDARPDDFVLLSDVDEIPRAASVKDATEHPYSRPAVHCFEQKMFKYFINLQHEDSWSRTGPRLCRRRFLRSMQALRSVRSPASDPIKSMLRWLSACNQMRRPIRRILHADAGWHFSSVGGAEEVAQKLASFSHIPTERRGDPNANLVEAAAARINRVGSDPSLQRVSIDDTFPDYLVENLERFSSLIDGS